MIPNHSIFDFLLVAYILLGFPILSALRGWNERNVEFHGRALTRKYTSILLRDIPIALFVIVLWLGTGRQFAMLGLSAPVELRSQVGLGLDLVLIGFLALQYLGLRKLPPEKLAMVREKILSKKIAPQTSAEFSLFVVVALVGSTWEELLFRGYLIWFLEPLAGSAGAILISAAAFGVGHAYQGWRNILSTALIGAALATCFVLTRNLWWLIVAHAAINIYGGIVGVQVAARWEELATPADRERSA